MTTAISPVFFEGQQLRVLTIDSAPWFVALDAYFILYPEFNRYTGVGGYLKGLDADERCVAKHRDYRSMGISYGPNAPPSLTLISRPGLMKLVQRSSRPEARRFDRWVRHEVLPSIMDTGKYEMPGRDLEEIKALPALPAPMQALVARYEARFDTLLSAFAMQTEHVGRLLSLIDPRTVPAALPHPEPHWADTQDKWLAREVKDRSGHDAPVFRIGCELSDVCRAQGHHPRRARIKPYKPSAPPPFEYPAAIVRLWDKQRLAA